MSKPEEKSRTKDDETKERHRLYRENLRLLDILEKLHLERVERSRKRIAFTKGIALGLFFGILGNLLVQSGYSLFERGIIGNLDIGFWLLIPVFFAVLIIFGIKIRQYILELKEEEKEVETAKNEAEKARKRKEEYRLLLSKKH